jgi:quercetin dioxygenase-like cupin family protein
MKHIWITLLAVAAGAMLLPPCRGEEAKTVNVLMDIPYAEEGMGKRKLVDEEHLLMMQAALKPGQKVPDHQANSNVHILVVEGTVIVQLDETTDHVLPKGSLLPVEYGTPMHIRNEGDENAAFLIMKTPHPSHMKEDTE